MRRIVALAALLIMPAVPSADEVAADADILSRLADDSTPGPGTSATRSSS